MSQVVCNGARRCREAKCYHHLHHDRDMGCDDECSNSKHGVPGSCCIQVKEIWSKGKVFTKRKVDETDLINANKLLLRIRKENYEMQYD